MVDLTLFNASYDGSRVAAGEKIFGVGQPADSMYVVLSGEIEIRVGEHVRDLLGAGDVFGELALIDGGVRTGTATAISDAVIVPIGRIRFEFLVSKHPSFALDVMATVVARLRRDRDGRSG